MYVPIIKWKMGEYQALLHLNVGIKKNICPLIEIPPIGWDFEKQRLVKTIDEHLSGFAKKLRDKWGQESVFVDLVLLGQNERMIDGKHPVEYVFDDVRSHTENAVPVTSFDRDAAHQKAVKNVIDLDANGLCIRLSLKDVIKGDVDLHLTAMAEYFGVDIPEIDIVLDLATPSFQPLEIFAKALKAATVKIRNLNKCRSFTLAATAFPESMGELRSGENIVSRDEWLLFKEYSSHLSAQERKPQFGDYTIAHPAILNMDMRLVKPAASLRYTIDDNWIVVKGKNVRDYKFKQYIEICRSVVTSGYFDGPNYSLGDEYIFGCSKGNKSTGTLSTWRWVGINHHMTKVVSDLSNSRAL
jgi:hypothetical protein